MSEKTEGKGKGKGIKVFVGANKFMQVLEHVLEGTDKKQLIPVYAHVMLEFHESESRGNRLLVKATDGRGWHIGDFSVMQSRKGDGESVYRVGVDGERILNWLKLLVRDADKATVRLEFGGEKLRVAIQDNWLDVPVIDGNEYPVEDDDEGEWVYLGVLTQTWMRRLHPMFNIGKSIAKERPHMGGVMFSWNDGVFTVLATDGHRLMWRPMVFEDMSDGARDKVKEVVEKNGNILWDYRWEKWINKMMGISGVSKVGVYMKQVGERIRWKFEIGSAGLSVVRYDGMVNTIPWQGVIVFKDKEGWPDISIEIERDELLRVVDAINVLSQDKKTAAGVFIGVKRGHFDVVKEDEGDNNRVPVMVRAVGHMNDLNSQSMVAGDVVIPTESDTWPTVVDDIGEDGYVGAVLNSMMLSGILHALGDGMANLMFAFGHEMIDLGEMDGVVGKDPVYIRTVNERGGGDIEAVIMPLKV